MKRQAEEDNQLEEPQQREVKRKLLVYKGDRISVAVTAALCKRDSSELLSNQPIILQCGGEDPASDFCLAYWPYDQEIGEKVVHALDQSEPNVDYIKQMKLVSALDKITRNIIKPGGSNHTKCRKVLTDLLGIDDAVEKVGLLAHLSPPWLPTEKDFFVIELKELSPHLYFQCCVLDF